MWPEAEPPRWVFRAGGGGLYLARSLAQRLDGADLVISANYLGAAVPRDVRHVTVIHGALAPQILQDLDFPARDRARRFVSTGGGDALSARRATCVVAVSEATARDVRRWYRTGVDAVIPNGVDVEHFSPRDRGEARARFGLEDGTRYALFVGRPEARKGADLIGPACEKAGWELLTASDRPGAAGRHLGTLSQDDLPWAYSAADCVLFPTRYEGCSYAILEALACGAPLVTTRVGWMETLLEHVPDYRALVVWHDAEDIAARLRTFDDVDHRALADRARAFVIEHNSLDAFREAWTALIARI
jgi:glycosyltransferase involved in cell wall biosynthesis